MSKIVFRGVILCLFFFSISTNSQTEILEENDTKSEKEKIEKAFFLLNSNKAEKAYEIAKNLQKKGASNYALINSNLLLAHYYNRKVAADSAIIYAKKSLQFNTEGGDSLKSRRRSGIYELLGKNYTMKGLYKESKKWYIKGIEEAQKYKEKHLYYKNTHGLALVYYNEGDLKKAITFFKECLEYDKDQEIIYGSYINLGIIHSNLKDYEASNVFLKKAYDISVKRKNRKAIAVILLNLGANAHKQKRIDEARDFYKKTIIISEEEGFHVFKIEARIYLGEIFVEKKDYENAKLIYSLAYKDALLFGLLNQELKVYFKLKEVAEITKNYKDAFFYVSKYFKVKDSINKIQKDEKISELEIKYETIKKEKEITLLKKDQELQESNLLREKENKKIILISFFIILLPITGLLVNYYLRLKTQSELNKKEKEINMQKITAIYKEKELELIKANIEGRDVERERIAQELHDSIGGNLAAIKLRLESSKISDPQYIKGVNIQIDNTYKQVRNISHSLIAENKNNSIFNTLEEYLNNIGDSSNITTSFTIFPREKINTLPEKIKSETFKIIQELITNTLKHADASFMDLNISLSEEKILNILFEDNGTGFDSSDKKEGLGLTNIRKRLSKINGELLIDSLKGRGTIINIEITCK